MKIILTERQRDVVVTALSAYITDMALSENLPRKDARETLRILERVRNKLAVKEREGDA